MYCGVSLDDPYDTQYKPQSDLSIVANTNSILVFQKESEQQNTDFQQPCWYVRPSQNNHQFIMVDFDKNCYELK